jgi:N-acetylmuramic acid 6-phosphate etherase
MTGDDMSAPLTTETGDARLAGIDRMATADLAALMNDEDATVPLAVRAALPAIVLAIDATVARMAGGGRLIYVGAGSSGRIGVLDASEIPPTFGTSPDHVVALIAGGPDAIVLPQEGAEDDVDAGIAAIHGAGVSPADVVVGIASSGRTPYVIAALGRAGELGACTIGLSCNAESELSAVCDIPIEVPVGPEFVAGSTRLKAGTAQKLVLNMLSTITMVRLGKTYGNLMVDLSPTNTKLRARATGIVSDIAGVGRDEAAEALRRTAFDVKQAVLVARLRIPPEEASARLTQAGGRLRGALDADPPKETRQ